LPLYQSQLAAHIVTPDKSTTNLTKVQCSAVLLYSLQNDVTSCRMTSVGNFFVC